VGPGTGAGGAGQQGSERAVEQRRGCLGGEEGADEGGPGVSGTTAERKTRHWENGTQTSGPELADSERARGAEGAERVGVGPAGRDAWEWPMHAERAAALDVSEGRWAGALRSGPD